MISIGCWGNALGFSSCTQIFGGDFILFLHNDTDCMHVWWERLKHSVATNCASCTSKWSKGFQKGWNSYATVFREQ